MVVVFEWAKTFCSSERAATVVGPADFFITKLNSKSYLKYVYFD
jgi:hypothetical protein